MEITVDLSGYPQLMNDWCKSLMIDQNRYIVLKGGGGSGKSVFAAQKLIYRMITEEGHRFLVVRKVAKTIRESCFSLLKELISDYGLRDLFKIYEGDKRIVCISNDNEILFAGLDDVEKLKSINKITGVWVEEASELNERDLDQLDIRLRGRTKNYKQIILSFNPISALHWLKRKYFDKQKKNSTVKHTTYKDNKFLDQENIDVLEAFKESDYYYYSVYALGEWGIVGKTVFNGQIVTERINQLRDKKPLKRGYFDFDYINEKIIDASIKWIEDEQGSISIYKEREEGYPYVGGGDTAGDGSDYFGGQFLNNITVDQVAVLHNQFDEDLYSRQMYCLGKYYNYALLSIETNFSTYPVKELERLGYWNQYKREVIDTYTMKKQEKHGFNTNKKTRPVILANLVQIARENIECINDLDTLNEMITFVRNEKGKAEAAEGAHDDLIMSLAIAHDARDQQTMRIKDPKKRKIKKRDRNARSSTTGY